MALYKLYDFDPDYRNSAFGGKDIKGLDVYAGATEDKVGSVHDVLIDETGRMRYLVVDTGFWIFGKKVLVPFGRCRFGPSLERIHAIGLTSKEQLENMPDYEDDMTVDFDYEERVRKAYRPAGIIGPAKTYDQHSYRYGEHDPDLYNPSESDHQQIKLYEERLIARKERHQTDEVTVGKRVTTDTAEVSVPVEKERVVIERTPATNPQAVAPGEATFQEGEVARIAVHEETADIEKQAFVREKVSVRKEVDRSTVDAKETVRREELDINDSKELNNR
ncbi:DUF2382 domain-containing protein [Acaryochloris sp. CCMEE 5410]|uniref:DUF2382 domain-containing protein n=1 Tax=Acaryochloris sp. CCMEE 5410 TaxID=310037 RepID=UPI0002484CBD|nr:DUF2382 domain-containing protein [Acaryochloris sp. CCMEE 5410]KAI9132322.1 DUF2382 domain-containing protein [Acaryochloris sp. CCMEE 5410]